MTRSSGEPFDRDFRRFWAGQVVSNCGNAITTFALPLLVFQLTDSPLQLATTTAVVFLPYMLFGLPLGAWVDRVDRRRLMIGSDVARALLVTTVPLAAAASILTPWWIYAVTFASSTLAIAFDAASFAAVPFLVSDTSRLVVANGRLQAGFSAASLTGPLLGGLLLTQMSVPDLLVFDAASYVVSAVSLSLVRRRFNAADERPSSASIVADVRAGLSFVWTHPLLRSISVMAALVNVFLVTTFAQIVLLAERRLGADATSVSWFYSAGSAGIIAFGLAAGWLRSRLSLGQLAIAATVLNGVLTLVLSQTRSLWLGLAAYSGVMGATTLFGISSSSLRQAISPTALLGRVVTVAQVIAWSVQPPAAILGGYAVQRTGSVSLVYAVVGVALVAIGLAFVRSPVGRSGLYTPAAQATCAAGAGSGEPVQTLVENAGGTP